MRTVGLHSPLDQNLSGASKSYDRAPLPNCDRRQPEQHEAILSKWHAVIGVAHDLQKEAPVPSRILQRLAWQPPNGEPAENEWTGSKRYILLLVVSPAANDLDSTCLFDGNSRSGVIETGS